LHVGKVPTHPEDQLQFVLTLFRRLTGKESTPEDTERARQTLVASEEIAAETFTPTATTTSKGIGVSRAAPGAGLNSARPTPYRRADQEGNVGKVPLFLAKVPTDVEGRVKLVSDMYRSLTGKESTPEALAKARATFEATDEARGTLEAKEALVVVDDSNYIDKYKRVPTGAGAWAFCAVDPSQPDYLNHVIWVRGKFTEAKQKALRIAAKRGIDKLWVCA
jgi:hypothetical protein